MYKQAWEQETTKKVDFRVKRGTPLPNLICINSYKSKHFIYKNIVKKNRNPFKVEYILMLVKR